MAKEVPTTKSIKKFQKNEKETRKTIIPRVPKILFPNLTAQSTQSIQKKQVATKRINAESFIERLNGPVDISKYRIDTSSECDYFLREDDKYSRADVSAEEGSKIKWTESQSENLNRLFNPEWMNRGQKNSIKPVESDFQSPIVEVGTVEVLKKLGTKLPPKVFTLSRKCAQKSLAVKPDVSLRNCQSNGFIPYLNISTLKYVEPMKQTVDFRKANLEMRFRCKSGVEEKTITEIKQVKSLVNKTEGLAKSKRIKTVKSQLTWKKK